MSESLSCLVVDDDPVSRELVGHYVQQHDGLALAGSCESAIEATNLLRTQEVDLVFLDVEMPGMSGLEWLSTKPNLPNVIIVSSHREYAVDAFEVDVVDYLLKPVSYARFLKAVDRVVHQSSDPIVDPDDHVFLKSKGRLVRLDLVEVLFVEAQADYVLVHTPSDKHLVHGTMKSFEDKLPERDFVRVHRSYIVRQDKIDDVEESSIVVGREVIPIGPSYREKVLGRLPKL
jgi:DNA-binding LytR/AlgR family response regulator